MISLRWDVRALDYPGIVVGGSGHPVQDKVSGWASGSSLPWLGQRACANSAKKHLFLAFIFSVRPPGRLDCHFEIVAVVW